MEVTAPEVELENSKAFILSYWLACSAACHYTNIRNDVYFFIAALICDYSLIKNSQASEWKNVALMLNFEAWALIAMSL